jgi:hypothetical protein
VDEEIAVLVPPNSISRAKQQRGSKIFQQKIKAFSSLRMAKGVASKFALANRTPLRIQGIRTQNWYFPRMILVLKFVNKASTQKFTAGFLDRFSIPFPNHARNHGKGLCTTQSQKRNK